MTTYNLADLFELVVDTVPARIAVVSEEGRLSYARLDKQANRLAHFLLERGVGPGDHVGVHMRNGPDYLVAMLAAFKIRAVPININYNYVEAELRQLYDYTDLVATLVQRQFAPRLEPVLPELEKLHTALVLEDGSEHELSPDWIDYDTALAASSAERGFAPRSSDDVYIICTGGTTGLPKGVMWRHEDIFFASLGGGDPDRSRGFVSSPTQLAERIQGMPMTTLPAPPLMHAAAQWGALGSLLSGGSLVFPARGAFDTAAIWQSASEERALALLIVGDAMAIPLLDELEDNAAAYDLGSLFVIASAGAILSPVVKQRLLQALPHVSIFDGLGSSETGVMGNQASSAGQDETSGRFTVGEFVQVLDDNMQPIAPGSDATGLLARGGHVPLGYYNAPEKSAETFVTVDGRRWALPGDLARVEADGSIQLLGRGSTSINTGGEKVFPEEVEMALKAIPQVFDALVVGVPDDKFGEAVTAICQLRPGCELAYPALKSACRESIAGYKTPRHLVLSEQIKRTPAGKADYTWARSFALDSLGLTG